MNKLDYIKNFCSSNDYTKSNTGSHILGEDIIKYMYNSQEICIQKIFLKCLQINTKIDSRLNRKIDKIYEHTLHKREYPNVQVKI